MTSRLRNAKTHRLFFMKETDDGDFLIKGTSNTLYTVDVKTDKKTCTCPDHKYRKKMCKHILFVLINILKYPIDKEEDIDTFCLSKKEKEKIRNRRKKFDRGDECPICFEPFGDEELVFCKNECGNNVHKICFETWAKKYGRRCIFCRSSIF